MFGGGGGDTVGAQVVLSANNSGYDTSMQQSAGITDRLGQSYDNLKAKIDRGFTHASHASAGIAAADVASLTAATVAAGAYQDRMRQLSAQSRVLDQSFGQGQARMREYERSVNSVRSSFGETTSAAAQLVQTISGFERGGSTNGLTKMASDFEKASQTTNENASALAQSVLTLDQAMGSGLKQAKSYTDQLVTMAEVSNTNVTSLANFAAQIAPLGRQLNMTQSEITGFAAAFSKAGQDGYRASNVFSQMTSDIAQSLQTNSPRLAAYASLLGVTTQALKGMSGAAVTSGLYDAIGKRGSGSLQTLNALGYDGLNVTRVISAVTQQSGGVGNMVRMSNGAYGDGSSGMGQQTASQQFAKLGQDLQRDGEIIGMKFLPALQGVMTLVDKLAAGFTSFMDGPGGDIVTAIAAITVPLAALVSGLLALHGAIIPLMTLMTFTRSSMGHGLIEGFRGGGRLGSGAEGRVGAEMAAAGVATSRPSVAKWYNRGQAVGGAAGGVVGNPRTRWVLGMDKLSAEEEAARVAQQQAAAEAGPGFIGRTGSRVGGFVKRNLILPQVEPSIQGRPDLRQPMFGAAGGAVAAEERSAAGALAQLKAGIHEANLSMREWAASLTKSSAGSIAASSEASSVMTKSSAELVASSTKVDVSLAALVTSTEAQATASKAASMSLWELAKAGTAGALKGGAGLVAGGAGIGLRGAAAGASMLGPVGLGFLALMAAPMLAGPLRNLTESNSGRRGPGPSDVAGTGLSFGVSNVIAPVAQPGAGAVAFNPLNPSPQATYAASQRKDFVNAGVRNIKDANQAASIYGSVWGTMGAQNQASLGQDLLAKLGRAGYMDFIAKMNSGNYTSPDVFSATQAGTVKGGLSMAFSSLQQSQAGQTNTAGNNLRDLAATFLTAAPIGSQHLSPIDNPRNRNNAGAAVFGGAMQFALGGGSRYSTNLANMNVDHGWLGGRLGIGGSTSYTLTGTGSDFAGQLYGGTPDGGQQSRLAKALYQMPKNLDPKDQLAYLLKHVSKDDLAAAMKQQGLDPTGNRTADIAAVTDAYRQKSRDLPSALRGLGLSDTQKREVQPLDATNPGYYGATLYEKGIGQRRLSQLSLEAGSLIPGTIQAAQAYGANQMALYSPFLSPTQQIFGSQSGLPGQSGMNAGMISTPLGQVNGQFSTLGIAQGALRTATGLQATGQLSGNADALGALSSSANNLVQSYTSQLQTMKQYQMSLDQLNFSSQQFKQSMAWQAQQEKLTVGREKADEARNTQREEYSYNLQRKRAEADFQRSRRYAEDDYNLQRTRAMSDFTHQTEQMIKQASMSMMDVYKQNPAQGFTSAQFLLYNNSQQTSLMHRQESQLGTLRGMGLSKDSIQQLGLTNANNTQELNGLFNQIQQNPALIDQLNSAVQQRLTAAGALATDASSMTYQEQVYQFNLSLDRGAEDFSKAMKRSGDAFDIQMERSSHDFARQMALQNSDFHRQLARQAQDYNTAVSHSWTTFGEGVQNSLHQMKEAAKPLADVGDHLAAIAKKFGDSDIGKQAAALEKSTPMIMQILNGISNLLNPKDTTGPKEPAFLKLLDILNAKGTKFFQGVNIPGGGAAGGAVVNAALGGGLPAGIAERMKADHPTSGMCLRDVEDVLGTGHSSPTAFAAWVAAKGHRHMMGGLFPAPVGAPIFFGPEYGNGAGHIAINAGLGMMWSEDASNRWEKKRIWPGALGWSDTLDGTKVAPNYGQQGFAKGTWDLPADMIAQIHKGEMIIPAKVATAVRSVITKSQAASLHTTAHPVYNHVDARTYHTTTETNFNGEVHLDGVQNPAQMAAELKDLARFRALAKR